MTDSDSASPHPEPEQSASDAAGTGPKRDDAISPSSRTEATEGEAQHDSPADRVPQNDTPDAAHGAAESDASGDLAGDKQRNAPPPPSRQDAGRSHVGSQVDPPPPNASGAENRAHRPEDARPDDMQHEVFILTPAVMRRWAGNAVRGLAFLIGSYYLLCTVLIISYRWIDPPTTGVQLQRSIGAWWSGDADYEKTYRPVPLASIDDDLELAVVAAEDTRFFQHTGIDWEAIGEAIEDNRERGFAYRGGSTITQQLAKNLFQTTHSSFLRKGMEVPLTFLLEIFLPKERILEIYLNVIEWGPGVFGVEAAVQHHYGGSAKALSRYRAAALAACIPNPLVRTPARMGRYTRTILGRMYQLERIEPRFAR